MIKSTASSRANSVTGPVKLSVTPAIVPLLPPIRPGAPHETSLYLRHHYGSSEWATARQHKVAEVACCRLERALTGGVRRLRRSVHPLSAFELTKKKLGESATALDVHVPPAGRRETAFVRSASPYGKFHPARHGAAVRVNQHCLQLVVLRVQRRVSDRAPSTQVCHFEQVWIRASRIFLLLDSTARDGGEILRFNRPQFSSGSNGRRNVVIADAFKRIDGI